MRQLLFILVLFTLFSSCGSEKKKDVELDNLITLLEGKFSNEEQVKKDSGFAHLSLINVRIWKDRPEYWIYSEVSGANKDDYVYSQRILTYQRLDSSNIISTGYKIPNSKDYQSGWENIEIFENLTPESLEIRNGCEVYFKKKTSTIYSGKTKKGSCESSIKEIDYITSSFVVSKDKISIWTRGYNKKGNQVWGKIKGPYKYRRISTKSNQ